MKTLLVGINARYTHSNLALFYLRNEIAGCGHEARILEFHISQPRLDIIQEICVEQPEALLFSAYVWNAQLLRTLLPDLHRLLPEAAIVLGGPEAGYRAESWLSAFPFINCVVKGPGEGAARFLAQRNFKAEGNRILELGPEPFDSIPFPYAEADLDRLDRRYVYYESSRGCPFSCSYCLSSRSDHSLDEKSLPKTFDELSRIIAHEKTWPEPPIVKFVDRSFNAHGERARAIWRFLAQADTRAIFHFEIHPALLGDEDFTLLSGVAKGRFQFEIGIQSVNARTLETVNRSMDWEGVKPRIARLIGLGTIHIHMDMIAGLPGEGLEEVGRSLDEILSLRPPQLQMGFLKSLPGTALDAEGAARGQIAMADPPYQVLSNDTLSVLDFRRLKRVEALLDSVWNANRFEIELDDIAQRDGGYFSAFLKMSEIAERTGFDLSTRNAEKVKAFLLRCAAVNGNASG